MRSRLAGPLVRVVGRSAAPALCLALAILAAAALPIPADTARRDATYLEESDPAVTWSGPWSAKPLAASSGGSARLAMDPGAEARLEFEGPAITWIGYRDEWSGIANVLVDGTLQAAVDTYASPARAQATLYTVSGLDDGRHVLVIRATGTHSPASGGAWIWVDAFAVGQARAPAVDQAPILLPPRPPPLSAERGSGAGRPGPRSQRSDEQALLEQDDARVRWSGAWSTNHLPVHSGGSARLAMEPTSQVSFSFTGSGVAWIGYRDEWSGVANVLLDGRMVGTVDTYAKPARAQAALYVVEDLREGRHTLTIQPTGRRHPASGGAWIWVDAFSVVR